MSLRTLRNRVRCYLHVVWQDTPALYLLTSVSRLGMEFPYNGDTVIWTWPWTREDRQDGRGRFPFISLGFSGTGEWGDAHYATLKELDADWTTYFEASAWDVTIWDGFDGAPQPVMAGDAQPNVLDLTENLNTPTI